MPELDRSRRPPAAGGGDATVYGQPRPSPCSRAPGLTLAFKLLGRRGEEQLALHVWGPRTAGNARFLIACLHPAGQPAEVAVAVQRVGPNGPASESRGQQSSRMGSFTQQALSWPGTQPGAAKNPNAPQGVSLYCTAGAALKTFYVLSSFFFFLRFRLFL